MLIYSSWVSTYNFVEIAWLISHTVDTFFEYSYGWLELACLHWLRIRQSLFGERLLALEYNTIKLCSVEWVELLCAAVGEFADVWTSTAALTMDSLITQVNTTGLNTMAPDTAEDTARSMVWSVYMRVYFQGLGFKAQFYMVSMHGSYTIPFIFKLCKEVSSPSIGQTTIECDLRPCSCLYLRLIDTWFPTVFRAEEFATGVIDFITHTLLSPKTFLFHATCLNTFHRWSKHSPCAVVVGVVFVVVVVVVVVMDSITWVWIANGPFPILECEVCLAIRWLLVWPQSKICNYDCYFDGDLATNTCILCIMYIVMLGLVHVKYIHLSLLHNWVAVNVQEDVYVTSS